MLTLRGCMESREGADRARDMIARGRRAWAVERWTRQHDGAWRLAETAMVFGTCRSDALRQASAPARLGEETASDRTLVAAIGCGWTERPAWPAHALAREARAAGLPMGWWERGLEIDT